MRIRGRLTIGFLSPLLGAVIAAMGQDQVPGPFTGHLRRVESIRFSPDGKHVVSASSDGGLRVWRIADGTLTKALPRTHELGVTDCAFSPDGKLLASSGYDHAVRVWSTKNWELRNEFKGHDVRVFGVCFSPDGRYVVSADGDCTLIVWDLQKNAESSRADDIHRFGISAVCFHPTKVLVSCGRDGRTCFLEFPQMKLIKAFGGHEYDCQCLAVDRRGKLAVSGGKKRGRVNVFRLPRGKKIFDCTLPKVGVYAVALHPKRNEFVVGGTGGTLQVWDWKRKKKLRDLKGHTGTVLAAAYSPDGKWIATGGEDRVVRFWPATKR